MAITGTVNVITDATAFFGPLLIGNATKPTGGYKPFTGNEFSVVATGSAGPDNDHIATGPGNTATGAFNVPEFSPSIGVKVVGFNVMHGKTAIYRSGVVQYARAVQGGLDIYILQPPATGISAGAISNALKGAASSLPGNTNLTADPWGFSIAGSQSGADVQFGVGLVPHTSTNLNVFLELILVNWNIHVGFPADICKNADDILRQIRQTLASEDSDVNAFVKSQLLTVIKQTSSLLGQDGAQKLLGLLAVTFISVVFPDKHEWALSNTKDETTVMKLGATLGYPRTW